MFIDPQTQTVFQAQQFLNENIVKGVSCPCCEQKAKAKKTVLNHLNAALCTMLYKTFPVGTQVNVRHFIENGVNIGTRTSELTKGKPWDVLSYWALLEEVPVTKEISKAFRDAYPESKGKRLQLHKLTDRGLAFYQGQPVLKTLFVFNGEVKGWDDKESWTLMEALGQEFDLQALWDSPTSAVGHFNL